MEWTKKKKLSPVKGEEWIRYTEKIIAERAENFAGFLVPASTLCSGVVLWAPIGGSEASRNHLTPYLLFSYSSSPGIFPAPAMTPQKPWTRQIIHVFTWEPPSSHVTVLGLYTNLFIQQTLIQHLP